MKRDLTGVKKDLNEHVWKFDIHFLLSEFTLRKAEQPLQGMELQEKEHIDKNR